MKMYHTQLAHIHDRWFSDFSLSAAKFLKSLGKWRTENVVDLGCGSGTFLAQLKSEKIKGWGIDLSPEMIKLCRKKLPSFNFQQSDLFSSTFPEAKCITAIGEILSYACAKKEAEKKLKPFFKRVFKHLKPNGIFLFDVLVEDKSDFNYNHFTDQKDLCIYMKSSQKDNLVTREITSFLKIGKSYQKDVEIHKQRVFKKDTLKKILKEVGFKVKVLKKYGSFSLPRGRRGFLCKK